MDSMRRISVAVGALALIGCCVFVMQSENSTALVESVKSSHLLPKALREAASKAGDTAKAPKIFPDKELGYGTVWHEHEHKAVGWTKAVGALQANCLALKAYAYAVEDTVLDDGAKDLGVLYQLLRAMTPTVNPMPANETPKECVAQYKAFMDEALLEDVEADSIPRQQLDAIADAMKGAGILETMHMDAKRVISINGVAVGLASHKVIAEMKGMAPMASEVQHQLATMKTDFVAADNKISEASTVNKPDELSKADQHELVDWTGGMVTEE